MAQPKWQDLQDAAVAERFGPKIRPKTPGQQRYLDSLFANRLTFCLGPAGSGKGLLACLAAAKLLREKAVDRIVLSRPLAACDEEIGHLPGELADKTAPHRAVLEETFGAVLGEDVAAMARKGQLVFAPLGFLRGTTFRRAFVILDEAQNTTPKQMRMFLTRPDGDTRVAVCGDAEQLDIRGPSGLADAVEMFREYPLDGAAVVELTTADICRGGLVREVEKRYRAWNEVPPAPSYGPPRRGPRG